MTRNKRAVLLAVAFLASGGFAFRAGIEYSRHQVRALAREMAAQPTNAFTACLTGMWEQSGELAEDWREHRTWVLGPKKGEAK